MDRRTTTKHNLSLNEIEGNTDASSQVTNLNYSVTENYGNTGVSLTITVPYNGMTVIANARAYLGIALVGATLVASLRIDSGSENEIDYANLANVALDGLSLGGVAIFTNVSAGSHTIYLRVKKTSALGTITLNSDSNRPTFIKAVIL